MTNVEMYMNIYKKYGKDSNELAQFKLYFFDYGDKEEIMERIYKTIMKSA